MTAFVFDIAAFRVSYPAFANVTTFPDATLQAYWDAATCYITNSDSICGDALCECRCGSPSTCTCRYRALTLMTAHLTALSVLIAAGQTPGLVQSATIDKITVSLTPPPLLNQFQWWLSLTPYGQQLLALLSVSSVGGFFVGGLPERAAFRQVGGRW